jgi:hypothetical protein
VRQLRANARASIRARRESDHDEENRSEALMSDGAADGTSPDAHRARERAVAEQMAVFYDIASIS